MRSGWTILICFVVLGVASGQQPLSDSETSRLWQSAHELLEHRDYGGAYQAFTRYIDVSPEGFQKADAAYYRAFCAVNLYHEDGEKSLEDFIARYPEYPKTATAYYELGSFFYNGKNYAKASECFAKAKFASLSEEQQHIGRFRWGYSLFNQRLLDKSLEQFNAIKAMGGTYGPAASYYAGFIENGSGDYENALKDLQRAETAPAYATVVPVLIMNVYNRQHKDDALIRYGKEALKRENVLEASTISLLTAEALFRKKQYEEALGLYEASFGESTPDRGVSYRAGQAALALGKDEDALKYFKGAVTAAEDSLSAFASYHVGILYLKRQEKPLALNAFDLARKYSKDPRLSEECLYQAAKLNYELGRADISIQQFESLLKLPQGSHALEAKELLSQAYVNANNYNKAIEYIEALPSRTPSVDRAYQKATYLKGTELFNKEEYALAVNSFARSLEYPIDKEIESDASFWTGEAYSIGRKYDEAIPFYERALHASLARAHEIHYALGYAYFNTRNYSKALVQLREFSTKATPAVPNYADGMIRLGDCYYAEKSYADAVTTYRKAALLAPAEADYIHLQTGLCLAVQNRFDEAAREFDAVKRTAGSRYAEDAMFQRAQLDFEQNRFGNAVTGYTQLISTGKSARLLPYAYVRRASANYNLKNYDATANDYITVLEKYPLHPAAQDLLLPLQEALNLAQRNSEFDKYLAAFKANNPDAKGIESVEFEAGKNSYFSQNYAAAITRLSRYRETYPESARLSEAGYYLAESYYRQKDLNKALEVYYQVDKDQTFSMLSKVVARIAEIEFKQGKYEKALPAFRRLDRIAANKKDQYTAWNGLMDTYYGLAMYDSSDVYARKIIEQGNVNANAQNKASLSLGKSAMARGDYETAKDEFLTTLNLAHDEYGAEAQYLLGEIFYLTKAHKQCYEALLNVNRDFGAYEAWVGKAYLLLADNFLAVGDTFQAKATLKSLIDNFPEETLKATAREKLKKIEEEERKKATVKTDTTGNEK